jgi:hypothetical protein
VPKKSLRECISNDYLSGLDLALIEAIALPRLANGSAVLLFHTLDPFQGTFFLTSPIFRID